VTNDDPAQSPRAQKIINENNVFIPKTVLLETEGVLRSLYTYEPARIAIALREFVGLPTVHVEDKEAFARALARHESGLDFADAVHLAASVESEPFITFDKAFAKKAARTTGRKVRAP
jgi:predicted nucleic acid-binding protein